MLGPYQDVYAGGGGFGGGGGGGGIPPDEEEPPEPPEEVTPVTTDKITPEPDLTLPAREYTSYDGRCIISIPQGLRVITESDKELEYVVIDNPGEIPPVPGPFTLITPVYRLLAGTADGTSEGMKLKQAVKLTIYYDTDKIPPGAEVYVIRYHEDSGWIRLDCRGDPSEGYLTAWVNYFNLVAVVVSVEEPVAIYIAPDIPEDIAPAPEVPEIAADVLETEAPSDSSAPLKHASLGVAVSGTTAMAVLALIQRRRRNLLARLGGAGRPTEDSAGN